MLALSFALSQLSTELEAMAYIEPYVAEIATEAMAVPESPLDALIRAKSSEFEVNLALVREIIRRESGFVPDVCNRQYGCKAGQGLMQLIPSRVKECSQRLGREIDPLIAEDNLDCGLYLLQQDGIRHWSDPDGKWGSGDYSAFLN